MEIFIAPSIKSFDLNPTHPGPLPRASFHTSANQQIERSESKAARGRARRATNEVGDALQKSASSDQDKLTKAGDMLQGQRVVASFCAQGARKLRPLRSASRSTLNGLAMISSSRLAELQHATSLEVLRRAKPRAFQSRKCSESRPARTKANKTSACGRNGAVTTRKDREEVEVLRGSLHGVARVLQAAQLQLQEAVLLPGCR